MTYRIILDRQPDRNVRRQIADLIGDEPTAALRDRLEIVLPDQSAVARVITQLTELGCRIASVDHSSEWPANRRGTADR